MGKYSDLKGLTFPSSIVKRFFSTTVQSSGVQATGASGNEGVILVDWIQERIDEGDIDVSSAPASATDLGQIVTADDITITSSSGDDTLMLSATTTEAGLMSALDKSILNAIVLVPENTICGRLSSGTGAFENLSASAVTQFLLPFNGSGPAHSQGMVPDPGSTAGSIRFLCEDGTWTSVGLGLTIGDGLIGDGSSGNPLDWAGAFTSGPITGSGTSLVPLDILDDSITSTHIQTGTILFSNINQNGASNGQVIQWNGSAWIASSSSLPAGSLRSHLIHNGTTWVSCVAQKEFQSGITGNAMLLALTPKTFADVDIYKNGYLQLLDEDYTIVGPLVSFITALVPTDKIITKYFS